MKRQRSYPRLRWAALLTAGLVAVLILGGCGAELPDDGVVPATSTASARRFAEKAISAGQIAADTGRFALTVTDSEVTSFLNIGVLLLQQAQTVPLEDLDQIQDIPELEGIDVDQWRDLLAQRDRLPNLGGRDLRLRLAIKDPAVHFRGSGEMIVRGTAKLLVLELPVRIVAAPRASDGELVLDFVEGQLGGVSMPELLFDALGKGLSSAILMGEDFAQITEISVGPGTLTVRGSYQQ